MAVYFVGMESTAGFGLLAGDRFVAPDAATAKRIAETTFLDETIPEDASAEDKEWLAKMYDGRRPRIAAGYEMRARKVRL